jgi:hypothetical protein
VTQHVAARGEAKGLMHRTLEAGRRPIVAEGAVSREAIDEAAAALAVATADPATVIGGPPTFQVWARKP